MRFLFSSRSVESKGFARKVGWMGALLVALVSLNVSAATPLVSFNASQGLPLASDWAGATSSAYLTSVKVSLYQDGLRQVMRLYDPGTARDDISNPKVAANRSYTRTLTAPEHVTAMTLGWSMKATLKLPGSESGFEGGNSAAGAWGVDSQHWFGYYMDALVWDAGQSKYVKGTDRYLYALMFGRNAAGETIVRPYGLGTSTDKVVTGDYHTYEIVYHAETLSASVYVDGHFWINYSANRLDVGTTDTRYMYWGDNNSQASATFARATYWDSVSFSLAPEPSRAILFTFGTTLALLRRRRPHLSHLAL